MVKVVDPVAVLYLACLGLMGLTYFLGKKKLIDPIDGFVLLTVLYVSAYDRLANYLAIDTKITLDLVYLFCGSSLLKAKGKRR